VESRGAGKKGLWPGKKKERENKMGKPSTRPAARGASKRGGHSEEREKTQGCSGIRGKGKKGWQERKQGTANGEVRSYDGKLEREHGPAGGVDDQETGNEKPLKKDTTIRDK